MKKVFFGGVVEGCYRGEGICEIEFVGGRYSYNWFPTEEFRGRFYADRSREDVLKIILGVNLRYITDVVVSECRRLNDACNNVGDICEVCNLK